MQCMKLTARPHIPSSSSLSFTLNLNNPLFFLLPKHHRRSQIKMSSTTQIIEHIVLFKIKPQAPPSQISHMLTSLNSLTSLPQVAHLSAAPIHQSRSPSNPLSFTHILHSRYASLPDLHAYSSHPAHLAVVADSVRPIALDIMSLDWAVNDLPGPITIPPGSAVRVTCLKAKEGLGDVGRAQIMEAIAGVKGLFPGLVKQLSCGENFSERSKGYGIGSLVVCGGVGELEELGNKDEEMVNKEKDKVRGLLEGVLVVDFVVPECEDQQAASSL